METTDISGFVPQEYAGKEWVQNIMKSENPQQEFFKSYEHAQTLIGKRVEIPSDNTPPEKVKEFYQKLGVPADISGYGEPQIAWEENDKPFAEQVIKGRNEDFVKGLKSAALEAGITPKQWTAIAQAWDKGQVAQYKKERSEFDANAKAEDEKFAKIVGDMYGDKADHYKEIAKKMVESSIPESLKPYYAGQSSEQLALLLATAVAMHKKYVAEDSPIDSKQGSGGGMSDIDRQAKAAEIMGSAEYRDPMNAGHEAAKKRLDALYR